MVDKIHLFILATFGESHEGGGLVELIFVVARKEREREGGREGRWLVVHIKRAHIKA